MDHNSPETTGDAPVATTLVQTKSILSWREIGLVLLLYFAAFFLFVFLARDVKLSVDTGQITFALLSAWIGALFGIALVFLWSRISQDNRSLLILVASGMAIDVLCNGIAAQLEGAQANGVLWLWLIALGNLGVLAAATGVGLVLARGLRKPNYLVVAALAGALADIASVYFGPSKHLALTAAFPYVAYQWGVFGQGVIPCVGAGDFLFLSLFFSGVRRFGLNDRKTLMAMSIAFGLGFASLIFNPKGIPALPFMAALLLLAHGRELKYSR